jgi:DNA-binding CsgD family transcriptional regulator
MSLVGVGEVRSISTVLPFNQFKKTRLYIEWAKPQGYGDATLAVLERSSTALAHLTTAHYDRDSPLTPAVRGRIALLVPHVRRAVSIARVIELRTIEAATLAETLDAISPGVFLVGPDGNIVRANKSGRAMLDAGDILRAESGTLVATDAGVRATLREAISSARQGDVALGSRGLAVPLVTRDGDRYVARVLPLTSGARRQEGARLTVTAALFVHRAAVDQPAPLEIIARQFQLTPAELRVLVAITEVGGVPEVAPVLGVSETTVKTHLQHVFEKTDTHRQADLVKLIASYASPVI